MPTRISRRALLTRIGASSLLAASPAIIEAAPAFLRGQRGDPAASDLFSLGVGSGDPDSRSVVLWTRLAPDPLEGGGMAERSVSVRYRVALDPGMSQIIRAGAVQASAASGHSVHVTLSQLEPGRWYWYQFEAKGARSRIGRTRTFPAWHQNVEQLRFALVSCQNYTEGYFAAYRDMLEQRLDFVLHVGDYIYESGADATPLLLGRNHTGEEIFTLDDYRNRYALYRLDSQLQDVHAALPFLCTWDDHEVDNNYAGKIAEESAPYQGKEFLERRANAYQVYGESMALDERPSWSNARAGFGIYRDFSYGSLANLFLLDTRQYRSDQPALDGFGSTDPNSVAIEPILGEKLYDANIELATATLLGTQQERWLSERLRYSRTQWNVIAQQIMLMPWNLRAAARKQVELNPALPPSQKPALLGLIDRVANLYNVDAWDGYPAARRRLLELIDRSGASNPVVLSGDIHAAWAANLVDNFDAVGEANLVAVEFTCSSITSTFLAADPRPTDFIVRSTLLDNPHIAFFNGVYRGYCVCEVDKTRWRTLYRAVTGDVTNPDPLALLPRADSPVITDKILEIDAGFNAPRSGKRLSI